MMMIFMYFSYSLFTLQKSYPKMYRHLLILCFFIFLFIFHGCKKKESNKNGDKDNIEKSEMIDFKDIYYSGSLYNRNIAPISNDTIDIIRLHFQERYGFGYTYSISKQKIGAYGNEEYKTYTSTGYMNDYICNGSIKYKISDEHLSFQWDLLVHTIDSLGVLNVKDLRNEQGFGRALLHESGK